MKLPDEELSRLAQKPNVLYILLGLGLSLDDEALPIRLTADGFVGSISDLPNLFVLLIAWLPIEGTEGSP